MFNVLTSLILLASNPSPHYISYMCVIAKYKFVVVRSRVKGCVKNFKIVPFYEKKILHLITNVVCYILLIATLTNFKVEF